MVMTTCPACGAAMNKLESREARLTVPGVSGHMQAKRVGVLAVVYACSGCDHSQ